MRFSLVLATFGRTRELECFFSSLQLQSCQDYELILVDQNEPDVLAEILERWERRLNLVRVRSERGVSKARNAGLARAKGDIIAFPDDDCVYSTELLRRVESFFAEHPVHRVLAVGVTDESGMPSGNRWFQDECEINHTNIFRTSATYSLFIRVDSALAKIHFDEDIGPNSGTGFGCGEDTDYALSILEAGHRAYFTRSLVVHHPRRDMMSGNASKERATKYGIGMGHVLRKHSLWLLALALVGYDWTRALFSVLSRRGTSAMLCSLHSMGILRGLMMSPNRQPVKLLRRSS